MLPWPLPRSVHLSDVNAETDTLHHVRQGFCGSAEQHDLIEE